MKFSSYSINRFSNEKTEEMETVIVTTESAIEKIMERVLDKKLPRPLESRSQAYRDIAMINRLVGNIQLAAKNWYRYMIVEGAKKGYQLAIDSGDAKGAAANLDKIGKYTMTDKEDNRFDYEKILVWYEFLLQRTW